MFRGYSALFILVTGLFMILGCGSGGGIVSPDTSPNVTSDRSAANQALLGLYTININSTSGDVDIVPHRTTDFQVNVVQYLQPPAGNSTNLGIELNSDGTDLSLGIIDLDISITHPFPGTNMRGFDVRGIVMGETGTQFSQFDNNIQYPKVNELRLLNADGYTRWWNATEFLTPGLFGYTPTDLGFGTSQTSVNGYKYFADDLEVDDPMVLDQAVRGTFSTQDPGGESNTLTRNYVIRFPMDDNVPQIKFQYAVCASFAAPATGTIAPGDVDNYGLEANCPEPYQLSISIAAASTMYYTSAQAGGDLVLNIEIADWQAAENPDGLSGEIGLVRLESPTLWSGLKDPIAIGTPIDASLPNASAWQVEIKDVTPTDEFQDIFLTVQSADPTSYAPPIPGDGIYPGAAVLSAYQLYTMQLPDNSQPIIGDIIGPSKYVDGVTLKYTLTSMDDLQDGPNLTVKWDFNNDGIYEDDEDGFDTNMSGEYFFTGDSTFFVQCRVHDTAMEYTDSNILTVEPMSLPFIDPMDAASEALWTVENGLFGTHSAALEWHIDDDHWTTGNGVSYEDYMDTTLISPRIPSGVEDTVMITLTHRYNSESYSDDCVVKYRKNSGSWTDLSQYYSGTSPGYPDYYDLNLELNDLEIGDYFELGFAWATDSIFNNYTGWDITHLTVIDNKAPVIEGIYGPVSVESLGPWTYSTVATDLDGIASYMWSVEPDGIPPVYDDPGDDTGNIDVTFPANGKFDIYVEVTDLGDPPLTSAFGPFDVLVFCTVEDAFFSDHFDTDIGNWTYTGGTGDGAYQDFWHIDTAGSILSNVGPDGCYAETDTIPIEKTATIDIIIPVDANDLRFRLLHQLGTEAGGSAAGPYDGQWVTLDGNYIAPTSGFLMSDNGGSWPHMYFVGYTDDFETSTFILGTGYNDDMPHTLTFHSLSTDTSTNCGIGWNIDLVELWFEE